jgi:antitoxin ParD1/3/4
MANMMISLPDALADWIENQVRDGRFSDASELFGDLVLRERMRQGEELSLDEVRQMVKTSRDSGVSSRSVDEIFAHAEKIAARQKAGRA